MWSLIFVLHIVTQLLAVPQWLKYPDADLNTQPFVKYGDKKAEKGDCLSTQNSRCESDIGHFWYGNDVEDSLLSNPAYYKKNEDPFARLLRKMEFKKTQSSLQSWPCSCSGSFDKLDLGLLAYPRYVPTMKCNYTKCLGASHCHHLYYKVRVLKRKDEENPERGLSDVSTPEDLKKDWTSDTITVTTACVCSP